MIKYVALLLVVVLSAVPDLAFAKTTRSTEIVAAGNLEVDGSFGFATGPGSFDSGYGVNFGAGYMLSAIDKNLQARIDMSYYNFSYDVLFQSLSYTRLPITVSGRYYFPIIDRLKAFAQAGLETSYDRFDYVDAFGKQSKSEFNIGVSPGGGIEFSINPQIKIFALGRWHLISDSYFSMQFGGAFQF